MMMRCSVFILLFFAVACGEKGAQAQSYQSKINNIWVSQYDTWGGLDFNGGAPVNGMRTSFDGLAGEAKACVCDENGELLFFSDGYVVWSKNNRMMPHGRDLNKTIINNGPSWWTYESWDGVAIVPMPDSLHKYYLFSVQRKHTILPDGSIYFFHNTLFYSIVNMKLNNGWGDVEPGGSIEIDSMIKDGIHAVPGENCDFWLLTHKAYTNEFVAYNINSGGIDIKNPVISAIGTVPPGAPDNYIGDLVVAPNRNKLVQCYNDRGPGIVDYAEVHDFNPATGIVYNVTSIPVNPGHSCKSAAFSPDGTKLYIGGAYFPQSGDIVQYDLSTPFPWSKTVIPSITVSNAALMRLGPDGKIYIAPDRAPSFFLLRVDNPDAAGLACHAVIDSGLQGIAPFPQEVPSLLLKDTIGRRIFAPLCFEQLSVRIVASDTGGYDYKWNLRDTSTRPSRIFKEPGIYTLNYKTSNPCAYHRDTFVVERVTFDVDLGPDTTYCNRNAINLESPVEGASYLWNDSSTHPIYSVTQTGAYWLQVEQKSCTKTDTVFVKLTNVKQQLATDTMVCRGKSFQIIFEANVPEGASVLWSTGWDRPALQVEDTGKYWVTVADEFCLGTDTVQINSEWCECEVSIPSAFSPNGDGKNDFFRPIVVPGCVVQDYKMLIYNRWGDLVYTSWGERESRGWNGSYKNESAPMGTYMYVIELRVGSKSKAYYKKGDLSLIR